MLLAIGIDLILAAIVLYVTGFAAQSLGMVKTDRICILLSVILLFIAPFVIVAGAQNL